MPAMLATDPTWGLVVGLMVLTALLFLYLLPTYIAYRRRHHQAAPIAVINICFGWTFLGWVAALAWSVSAVRA